MNSIIQAFGGITVGNIVIFCTGLYGIFQLGKRAYFLLSKIWEERHRRAKVKTTLDDVMDEIQGIKTDVTVMKAHQIFSSGREFKRLYFKAKKQYDDDGYVLFDTYEDIYQTYDAYKAIGGNGNKTTSMMQEIEQLPKQSVYSKVAKERMEKDDI